MYVEQLYTACLSEAAYYIESDGKAAVIDPLRDGSPYLELAKKRNAEIVYIFETHFHADFVSGHLDLAKSTNAPIVFGPQTSTRYPIRVAKHGEKFTLGKIQIQALHTPGHTIESTCYLLLNEEEKPYALFSGDTLFVGDVGRPDLSSGNLGQEELAGMLYDSIQQQILPLPDDVILYPAHGPGSSCGKNLGPQTFSTIGEQKKMNYALQVQSKEEFIKKVTEGLTPPPAYFHWNARINQQGYGPLESILKNALQPLSVEEFAEKSLEDNIVLLDTRNKEEFSLGFVPGSVFIGLEGRFAEWAGSLLSFQQPILLITEEGKEEESVLRLARVGFDKFEGFLKGGFPAWAAAGKNIDLLINVEADELAMDIPFDDNLVVVDVRKEVEFAEGHVKDAVNLPLETLTDIANISQIEEGLNVYLHCASGYRSLIAASLIKKQGIHNIRNVVGGFNSIKEQEKIKIEKEASVLN